MSLSSSFLTARFPKIRQRIWLPKSNAEFFRFHRKRLFPKEIPKAEYTSSLHINSVTHSLFFLFCTRHSVPSCFCFFHTTKYFQKKRKSSTLTNLTGTKNSPQSNSLANTVAIRYRNRDHSDMYWFDLCLNDKIAWSTPITQSSQNPDRLSTIIHWYIFTGAPAPQGGPPPSFRESHRGIIKTVVV